MRAAEMPWRRPALRRRLQAQAGRRLSPAQRKQVLPRHRPLPLAAPAVDIAWKGAPQFSAPGGWSFKPRGRLQVDIASVSAPDGISGDASKHLGTGTEFRRAYIGFDGTMPGGISYRVEADLAASNVAITDMYLQYSPSKDLRITVGQHKPFWGMEELTSDLFTSMMERASYTTAFGFERRLGASLQYQHGIVLAQGGVFGDDVASLNSDTDKNWSLDGRLVVAPRIGGGTLHLGGSIHFHHDSSFNASVTDQARPFAHTTDLRLVSTGAIPATSDLGIGLEAAYINGRFHATSESYWQTVRRVDGANPTFNGGYAEVGYLLTHDTTSYKDGVYDRIRPSKGIDKGGIGAIQVNARYDWLSLNDLDIAGGRQQTASVSAIWMLTDYVRLVADYGHVWVDGGPYKVNGDSSYQLDVYGMRAQFDF